MQVAVALPTSRRPWIVLLSAALVACGGSKSTGKDAIGADAAMKGDTPGDADASVDNPHAEGPALDAPRLGSTSIGRVDGSVRDTALDGETNAGDTEASSTWHLDPLRPLDMGACGFATRAHPLAPTALWGSNLKGARPTNAFWMNLVLDKGDQRISVLPYHVKALPAGLALAFPSIEATDTSVITPDAPQWMLGAVEAFSSHQVSAYDDLSVTVSWNASQGTMKAPLVYGMPYASVLFDSLTPALQPAPGVAILTANGSSTEGTVTAQSVTVTLNNGQTWKIYAPKTLAWTWSSSSIQASAALSGWIRIAYQPIAAAASILDQYAGAIPTGGSVDLSVSGDDGIVRFDWQRTGDGELLMMAMPHHMARMQSPSSPSLAVPSLSGTLNAIAAGSWTLRYPLSTITWTAPRSLDLSASQDFQAALKTDANFSPTVTTDPYFGGKQLAKLARLVLMAREQGENALASSMTSTLAAAAAPWLDGTNANPLVYDTTWGGIVTTKGLADSAADFGQGYYNDHHFHYGYHLYAAAVLAREDPTWASSHADKILCLARDIANPSPSDAYFPRVRNFDWFVGHSWAAGLFAFGDGRNQESTAEAVNAWYGVELYGRACGNATLTNLGRILRAMEVASAQTYWQIPDASTIYPVPFKGRHVVGVLWQTKADFTTFFGNAPEFIYGIQMIPFTPATEDLLSRAWITDAAAQLAAAQAGTTQQGWKGFMAMAKAVIDPASALSDARTLGGYDDGNSKANTLYWIATRPK